MAASIRYVQRSDIDIKKWDACILSSANGLCYAHSFLLDKLATHWDALIMNDYEAIMPLSWRKKYGFYYLYQPVFCQQLGIFSSLPVTEDMLNLFLQHIPSKFSLWDIQLNAANGIPAYPHTLRKNYLLSLKQNEEAIRKAYSRSAVRNIAAAREAGITVTEQIEASTVIGLHRKRFGGSLAITAGDYEALEQVLSVWQRDGKAFLAGALSQDGRIIASSAYFISGQRLIFIINGNLEESLQNGATHYLKDQVIGRFAGRDMVMDFEGSDNPAFARFYEQFGAREIEWYAAIRNNRLPWPLKWLKR